MRTADRQKEIIMTESMNSAINGWKNYIANTLSDDMDDTSTWSDNEVGEWAWAELVAQRDNDGSIHTQDDDMLPLTQDMIDWAIQYKENNNLPDDWSII